MPDVNSRLKNIQNLMANHAIDAIIVPTADPHLSEYLPKHWQIRQWLSGFSGSAGTLVVMADFVGLWTDSRYWIQAQKELTGTPIVLKKQGIDPSWQDFIVQKSPKNVAFDAQLLAWGQAKAWLDLCQKHGIAVSHQDLISGLWQDRESLPCGDIVVHDDDFVGTSTADKLAQVRQKMSELGATSHVISSLDDIAWLTNLRGSDVAFNPVFLAYFWLDGEQAVLFVDDAKLTDNAKTALHRAKIKCRAYDEIWQFLPTLEQTVLLDPNRTSLAVAKAVSSATLIKQTNPSTLLKAIKTDKEIVHIRQAMIQDGVALCEFFAQFEQRLLQGERLNECDVDEILTDFRTKQAHYVSPSFETIAGFGANGAVVHYRATLDECATLQGDGLLLIDSGGQYQNGTTDITRMVGIGNISNEQKRDVTYVLKAHIALAKACFVAGVSAGQLDALARVKLWEQGLDYGHGTGHGVGYFLNVHEGPQSISYHAPNTAERTMKVGMITSNEPGLYRAGKWGIRLENLLACVPYQSSEFGEFLRFETLTLCPFDTRLLAVELLTHDEKTWLNEYHHTVRERLFAGVSDLARAWLVERTEPI